MIVFRKTTDSFSANRSWFGCFKNVQDVTTSYVKDNFFEANAGVNLQVLIFLFVPCEVLQTIIRQAAAVPIGL